MVMVTKLISEILSGALDELLKVEIVKAEEMAKEKAEELVRYLVTNLREGIIQGFREGASILTAKLAMLFGGLLFLVGIGEMIDVYLGIMGAGYALVGLLLLAIGYSAASRY